MFNIKVKHFGESVQVRVYEEYVKNPMLCDDWGEKKERVVSKEFVPFLDDKVHVRDWDDLERSKNVSKSRTVQKVYDYARCNHWDWFVTLTFDAEECDRYDYADVCRCVKNWLDDVRRSCVSLRYLLVPELHKDGAYHFHGLMADDPALRFRDSGCRDKSGNRIYNLESFGYGFTTATRVKTVEGVSKYIGKYITKDLCATTFGKKRYWASRNLDLPVVEDYVFEGVEKAVVKRLALSKAQHVKTVESEVNRAVYCDMSLIQYTALCRELEDWRIG